MFFTRLMCDFVYILYFGCDKEVISCQCSVYCKAISGTVSGIINGLYVMAYMVNLFWGSIINPFVMTSG